MRILMQVLPLVLFTVTLPLQAAKVAANYPKVASNAEGTKGAIVAMLDIPYSQLLPIAKDLNQSKRYVHPKALETTVVQPGEKPILFLKVKIVGSMTRETYIEYTITESENKIIFEWQNVTFEDKTGSFKTNKGKVIYSAQAGNKTQIQYVIQVDANLTVPGMIKRKLMKDTLLYYVTNLEKIVKEANPGQ